MKTITSEQLDKLAEKDFELKMQLETDFYGFLLIYVLMKTNKSMDLNAVAEYIRTNAYQFIHPSLKFLYETGNGDERSEEQWHRKLQVKISSHWEAEVNAFLRKVVSRSKEGKSYSYKLSSNAEYFILDFLKRQLHNSDSIPGNQNVSSPMLHSISDQPQFIIFYGPPGTGKTNKVKEHYIGPMKDEYFQIVQIHPSYSYEDLVEGIKPVNFFDGEVKYEIVNGPIKVMSHKAEGSPVSILCCLDSDGNLHFPLGTQSKYQFKKVFISNGTDFTNSVEHYVDGDVIKNYLPKKQDNQLGLNFFIKLFVKGTDWGKAKYAILLDELNRGHVASILGELVFAIGESQSENPKGVNLQYSNDLYKWPRNLSLLATMNTADTTTDKIDQAIKRRFNLIKVDPFMSEDEWIKNIKLSCMEKIQEGKNLKLILKIILEDKADLFYPWTLLNEINDKLKESGKKYGAISVEEKLIGHSYLIKFCRQIIEHYLQNKDSLSVSDYHEHAKKSLRKILVEEIFPVLTNIFNNNKEKADQFIEENLFQGGAFNNVVDDLEKLMEDYETDMRAA
ncbi:MAG: AAA family ATPase [Bdellovibrionota bacterium]